MEQRIRRVAIFAVASALLVLALPLGWALRSALFAAQRSELQRAALSAAATVSPDFVAGDAVELPSPGPAGTSVAVYDAGARRRSGRGPATGDAVTMRAFHGIPSDGSVDGELVAAVPISVGERTIGAVRAASSLPALWLRVAVAWGALLAAVGTAFAIALYVARRQARALATPLQELARAATAVTAGDMSARTRPAGIREIDEVARSQNVMVERLLAMLRRERTLGTDIAHQLRTPLARLELVLQADAEESDDNAFSADARTRALGELRTLHTAVEDLLTSTGRPMTWAASAVSDTVPAVLETAVQPWRGMLAEDGRLLRLLVPDDLDDVLVPAAVARQVLGVLLDNAHRHGQGTVTVRARDIAGALAIDVSDEGSMSEEQHAPAATGRQEVDERGHGVGLALAADLASSVGGRLVLASRLPTTFTLVLP